jgi:hypothetical protein
MNDDDFDGYDSFDAFRDGVAGLTVLFFVLSIFWILGKSLPL